ncbi:MAG: CHAT domain-containing protein [Bacteroidetes bacterium]|nr:CHAT domain-containing protein [Bacteroidota bacterium]MBU1717729.1 CHAT domain-containing protein [Bacteroidota bacterium]
MNALVYPIIALFVLCPVLSNCQTLAYYDSLRAVYYDKQQYDSAFVYAEMALAEIKEAGNEHDTLVADMLLHVAEMGYFCNKFDRSIECSLEEIEIRSLTQGKNHSSYATAINNLGIMYKKTGRFSDAEPYYREALSIKKNIYGEKHSAYLRTLNDLASLCDDLGQYAESEELFKKLIALKKETSGDEDAAFAIYLTNFGALYNDMGNYAAAEPLFLLAIRIKEKTVGVNSVSYAISLNNLAEQYKTMGNFEAAEPLFLESRRIRKALVGEKHPDYATSSNNLADLYKAMGKFEEAEPLYLEAKSIRETVLGKKHPRYTTTTNNLALLYSAMGNYEAAEPLFIETKNIRKEIFGEKHSLYATPLCNLAGFYELTGKYAAAEPLYQEALKIHKETLGDKHPLSAMSMISMATILMKSGKLKSAEPYFLEGLEVKNENLKQNFSFLSEREKEMYFMTQAPAFADFYAYSLIRKEQNPGITETVFNNVVKNKGLLLKSSTAMRVAILNSNDTTLIRKYNQWIALKKEISVLYSTEISKRKKNPADLEQQANILEKDLVKSSSEFGDLEKIQSLSWKSVKNNLEPDEAAIEFIRFALGVKRDSVTYCALIVKPNSKYPEMIRLCDEKELRNALSKVSDNDYINVSNAYGTSEKNVDTLYQLIWQPMEKYLGGVKTVYFSPDGLLHKVSFAAIGKGKNVYLCDSYQLKQQSSTGKVAMPESFSLSGETTAGLFGGIEYSADTTSVKLWDYLPGTKEETDELAQIFSQKNISTTYLSGKDVKEEEIKMLAGKCNILHISTHGFFFPEPNAGNQSSTDSTTRREDEATRSFWGNIRGYGVWSFVKSQNPLMRSGLAMAFANNVWSQRFPGEGEDGVLTAGEVAQLNLQNTQLVVLSACETGLGDIKGSEGVYGLQRAFKMAGAKFLVMSLWQVPDLETEEFMTTFYTKLLDTKDIRNSFIETQTEMRKKYDPFFWAAFVLIE